MAKLLDVIYDLSRKGGVAEDDPAMKRFLSENTSLANIELPDNIASPVSSLMSFDAALNNPAIRARLKGETLSIVDTKLLDFAKTMQLSADEVAQIEGNNSSYKKMEILFEKLQALKNATPGEKGSDEWKEKVNKLQQEVSTYKQQLSEKDSLIAKAENTSKEEIQRFKQSTLINDLIRSQQWSDAYDEKVRARLFNSILSDKLQSMDATVVLDESDNLLLKRKDGTDYYDTKTNTQINFQDLTKQIMTENNLLKVNQFTPPPASNGNQTTLKAESTPVSTNPAKQQAQRAANESLEEFRKARGQAA